LLLLRSGQEIFYKIKENFIFNEVVTHFRGGNKGRRLHGRKNVKDIVLIFGSGIQQYFLNTDIIDS
jgi:hypothetical protein